MAKIVVSEAGASVYSASAFAAAEFPELDVSIRGAVSIARRLQDPLAELVKIEPKAIGVGQYQHDVDQHLGTIARCDGRRLRQCGRSRCEYGIGSVLARVSGLNQLLVETYRGLSRCEWSIPQSPDDSQGAASGDKTFEQAAGFCGSRWRQSLGLFAVHPEAYPVVERILRGRNRDHGGDGAPAVLKGLSAADFTDERFGVPTVRDILTELEKPGRDPRPEFRTATFREGSNRW